VKTFTLIFALVSLISCTVVTTAADIAATTVGTAVDVTAGVVSAGVDVIAPSDDEDNAKQQEKAE